MSSSSNSKSQRPSSSVTSVAGYDLWSSSYDQLMNPMLTMVDFALERRPINVMDQDVLEIGCGTGRNFSRLLSSGARSVIGVDNSAGMLEVAAKKVNDQRLQLLNADLSSQLPLEEACVDIILCTLVMEHIPFLLPIFEEMRRILRPSGRIRILEIHSHLVREGTQAHFQHQGQEVVLPSYPHDQEEWRSAVSAAGLNLDSLTELYPSQEAIRANLKLKKHNGKPVLIDLEASQT